MAKLKQHLANRLETSFSGIGKLEPFNHEEKDFGLALLTGNRIDFPNDQIFGRFRSILFRGEGNAQ